MIGASSTAKPLPVALPFDEVAQVLAQEPNLIRIKKLLIYICTQVWENDVNRLQQFDLSELLQTLQASAPTSEQLQSRLDIAVHSLSKAAEYALVASVIAARMRQLYPDLHPDVTAQRGLASEETYGAIAHQLEQSHNRDRIKKLLHLVCKNIWITDPAELAQTHLSDLIRELHQLTPRLTTLQSALDSRVNTLSKRAEYAVAAREISLALQPLYAEALIPEAIPPLTTVTTVTTVNPPQTAFTEPKIPESKTPESKTPELVAVASPDLSDLSNLRLEIMRYANAYRAKILLFSLLHEPFTHQAEQNSILKDYCLDDLLRIVLQTYRLADLEQQLVHLARHLPDPEESVQSARALLAAIKPYALTHLEPIQRQQILNQEILNQDATQFMSAPPQRFSRQNEGDVTIAMPNGAYLGERL